MLFFEKPCRSLSGLTFDEIEGFFSGWVDLSLSLSLTSSEDVTLPGSSEQSRAANDRKISAEHLMALKLHRNDNIKMAKLIGTRGPKNTMEWTSTISTKSLGQQHVLVILKVQNNEHATQLQRK